jgi:hypothetical protein
MGTTGNLRTLRNQSGTVGDRTLGSILASNGGGGGSFTRVYKFYSRTRPNENPLQIIIGNVSPDVQKRYQMFNM